jgi:hypothetical protein
MAHIAATEMVRVGDRRETDAHTISIITLGQPLSAIFILSHTLCTVGYRCFLVFGPARGVAIFFPGFALLSWHTFFLGLRERFVWGWYVALVFG